MNEFNVKEQKVIDPGEYSPADLQLNVPGNNNESEESEDDSDKRRLFELPKRKINRPPSLAFKRKIGTANPCIATTKSCCRLCSTSVLPLLFAVFIVSTILCIVFLLIGIAGMKSEMNMLKVKINNAESSERVSVGKTSELRSEFEGKLTSMKNHGAMLEELRKYIKHLENKISFMNSSINVMRNSPSFHVMKQVSRLKSDLDSMKSGMADTGSDIGKLEHTNEKLRKEINSLKNENKVLQENLFNLTVKLSILENQPPPSIITTPKTLVVTLTPDEDQPISRKEAKELMKDMGENVNTTLRHTIFKFNEEFSVMRSMVAYVNQSAYKNISEIQDQYKMLQKEVLALATSSKLPVVMGDTINKKISNISNNTKTTNNETLQTTAIPLTATTSVKATTAVVTSVSSTAINTTAVTTSTSQKNTTSSTTTVGSTMHSSITSKSKHVNESNTSEEIVSVKSASSMNFNHGFLKTNRTSSDHKFSSKTKPSTSSISIPTTPSRDRLLNKQPNSRTHGNRKLLPRRHKTSKRKESESENYHSRNIMNRLEKLKKMDPDYLKHLLASFKRSQHSDEPRLDNRFLPRNSDLLPRDDNSDLLPRDDSPPSDFISRDSIRHDADDDSDGDRDGDRDGDDDENEYSYNNGFSD